MKPICLVFLFLWFPFVLFSQNLPWVQDAGDETLWYQELKLREPGAFQPFESSPESWESWLKSGTLKSGFSSVWRETLSNRYQIGNPDSFRVAVSGLGRLSGTNVPVSTEKVRGTSVGGFWFSPNSHLVFSTALQVDNDAGMDSDYRGRISNELNNNSIKGFLFHRHAYVAGKWSWFEFTAGKQKISWGPTNSYSMLVGLSSPPPDLLWFRYTAGPFRLTHFYAQLDYSTYPADGIRLTKKTDIQRNLAGIRLEAVVFKGFTASLSQTILFPTTSPGFRLGYLNPLITYFGERENVGLSQLDDNIGYQGDVSWRLPGLHAYTSVLVDDFSIDGTVGHKLGIQGGSEISDPVLPFLGTVVLEYTRLMPKVYTVKSNGGPLWLNYVFYGKMNSITETDFTKGSILGHPIGPDAWQILIKARIWEIYPVIPQIAVLYQVAGTQNELLPSVTNPLKFPEKRIFSELKVGYDWMGRISVSSFIQHRYFVNFAHESGSKSDWLAGGSIQVDLSYSWNPGLTLF